MNFRQHRLEVRNVFHDLVIGHEIEVSIRERNTATGHDGDEFAVWRARFGSGIEDIGTVDIKARPPASQCYGSGAAAVIENAAAVAVCEVKHVPVGYVHGSSSR